MRLSQSRGLIISGLLFACLGAIAMAQDVTSKKKPHFTYEGLAPAKISLFKTHGLLRQVGLSLARWTVPDLADQAIVGYAFPIESFTAWKAEKLRQQLIENKVGVAKKLKQGGYAVMPPSTAKSLGLISYGDPDAFYRTIMEAKLGIKIVAPTKNFLDVSSDSKISHWNDIKLPPDKFEKKFGSLKAPPARAK